MVNVRKRGLKILGGLGLLLLLVLWLSPGAEADNGGYQPGLQHLYPYYIPDNLEQRDIFDNLNFYKRPHESAPQLARRFAREVLGLNELGSQIWGTALHNASQLDPLFNQDNRCGIAAWECDGSRWRRLLTFSQSYDLDYQDLTSQILFAGLELNQLSDASNVQTVYWGVYRQLVDAVDFRVASSVFMQDYLNQAPVDLSDLASTLYNYQPNITYNDPEPVEEPPAPQPPTEPTRPTEPEPQPPTEPPPTVEPPAPGPVDLGEFQPNTIDCAPGATPYIAQASNGDSQGRYLYSVPVINWTDSSRQTTTLMHRCLANSVKQLLDDFNETVPAEHKIGGWGWRSQRQQIELRKKHCGETHYDIWEKPANDCATPTAKPGLSSHPDGLAIDFYCLNAVLPKTNCGRAFEWLDCHAAKYGLINLPSETWHWYFPLRKPERLTAKLSVGCG